MSEAKHEATAHAATDPLTGAFDCLESLAKLLGELEGQEDLVRRAGGVLFVAGTCLMRARADQDELETLRRVAVRATQDLGTAQARLRSVLELLLHQQDALAEVAV